MVHWFRIFIFLVLGCCLCACSKTLSIQAQGSSILNTDEKGTALPVNVHVYQLDNINKFESANFDELWLNAKGILGNTLLSEDEFTLNPDENKIIKFRQEKNTHYVGIMAIFRSPANENWRVIEEMPENISYPKKQIYLTLKDNHIFLKSN